MHAQIFAIARAVMKLFFNRDILAFPPSSYFIPILSSIIYI